MVWNGEERRRNPTDHDTLICLKQIMTNHVENFNSHKQDFDNHKKDDKDNFKILNRALYIGLGGIGVVEFISRFWAK